jgi:GGDEF domain-containing protein
VISYLIVKEEISDVFKHNHQENLFLHRSGKSIHYDLIVPFEDKKDTYFFVGFKADNIQEILKNFILPHQELFLLRNDSIGAIELSSINKIKDNIKKMTMSSDKVKKISYSEPINNTRWNIAIRLSKEYKEKIIVESRMRTLLVVSFVLFIMLGLYGIIYKTTTKLISGRKYMTESNQIDPLTGFYNKYKFSEEVFKEIESNNVKRKYIIAFNMIGFEEYEGLREREYADYYLKQISNELLKLLVETYMLGRIGNTLTIYCDSYNQEKLEKVSSGVLSCIDYCNELKNRNIGLKVVVIELLTDFHYSTEVINIVNELDYKSYKDRITYLNSKSKEILNVFEEYKMLLLLKKSIKEEDIVLYHQKIQSTVDADYEHYEVLVRLRESGKIILPYKFIPLYH